MVAAEARLVARCRTGDAAAFDEIVRRHRPELVRYCRRIVGPDLCEDVVQQALMSAYVALGSGDRRDLALKPWLYRVARNAALDALRAEQRRRDDVATAPDVPQPAQVIESRERMRDVVAAVGALPERQRDALVMQTFQGLSYRAIASSMGEDVPVVRQLIHRARGRLRTACAALFPLPLLRAAFSEALGPKLAVLSAAAAVGAGATGTWHAPRPELPVPRAVAAAAEPQSTPVTVLAAAGPGTHPGGGPAGGRAAARHRARTAVAIPAPRRSAAVFALPRSLRRAPVPVAPSPAPAATAAPVQRPTLAVSAGPVAISADARLASAGVAVRAGAVALRLAVSPAAR